MYKQIKKAINNPQKIFPYLIRLIQQYKIPRVKKNGELFHRYKGELYPDYLNHGNACEFIKDKALLYCKGKGIDIGADEWPLENAIPIQENTHINAYKLNAFEDNSLDFIFSSHCLEHLEKWDEALSLWIKKIKKGGILFLYLPHKSMKLWNPGAPWVGNNHKWIPTYEKILPFITNKGIEIIEYNPDKDKYWSFHILGKKIF